MLWDMEGERYKYKGTEQFRLLTQVLSPNEFILNVLIIS